MITFEQFVLLEQDPMAGGAGLGAPGGLPGGGGLPPGGDMGAGGAGLGGDMGGGAAGGGAGPVMPTKTEPTDVWKVLNKILEGKPIKHEKQSRPQHQNVLGSGQAPMGGGMPPAGPPGGPMGAGPLAGPPPMAGGPMATPPGGGMGGSPMGI